MKFFFTLLVILLLSSYTMKSQDSYRVIGMASQIEQSLDSDFFISSIEDQRSFRANLGIVNRGAGKAIKRPLIGEVGFMDTILNRMNGWLRPGQSARPVVAQVRELYFWEHLHNRGGEGFVRLEVAFLEPHKNAETLVELELSGEALNVANGHSPRLEVVFFKCLQQFISRKEKTTAVKVSKEAPPSLSSKLQAAANFLDLRAGNYAHTFSRLKRASGHGLARYHLASSDEDKFHSHYAVIREQDWYINGNNYPGGGDYYTKVLEKGRYLYLEDEVYIRPESELRTELPQFIRKVGIVIDMETGFPEIVDDKLMEQLMAPYPALQEKYLLKDILKYPVQLTRVKNAIAEINLLEQMN